MLWNGKPSLVNGPFQFFQFKCEDIYCKFPALSPPWLPYWVWKIFVSCIRLSYSMIEDNWTVTIYQPQSCLWWGGVQKTHANFQSSYVIGSGGVSASANLCLWMSLKYATVLLVMPQCFFLAYVVYLGSAKPNLAIVYLIFNISHGKYLWEKLKSTSNNFQMFHSLCKEHLRIIITRRDQSFHYWLSRLSGRKKQK